MMNFETINLSDYELRGEGSTAQTYYSKDGQRLAKLYFTKPGAEAATSEFRIAQVVHSMGIPTPLPIRLITDGVRIGTEFELFAPVGKRSFARIFSEEPDQIEPLSREFAQRARQLHQTPADTDRLPSMKSLVHQWIDHCRQIPADYLDVVTQTLDETPDQTTCLHGDLHVGNLITDGQRRVWIDVGDFSYGVPEWDNCMIYYMGHYMPEERCRLLYHVGTDVMRRHWQYFASEYYGQLTPQELHAKEEQMRRMSVTKILFRLSKYHDGVLPPTLASYLLPLGDYCHDDVLVTLPLPGGH